MHVPKDKVLDLISNLINLAHPFSDAITTFSCRVICLKSHNYNMLHVYMLPGGKRQMQ